MNATDTQVGGTHYLQMPYQPIRLITELQMNFFQGSILKYLCRYRHKGGKEDLKKAIHYCQLAKKMGPADECTYGTREAGRLFRGFCRENGVPPAVIFAIDAVLCSEWDTAEEIIDDIILHCDE